MLTMKVDTHISQLKKVSSHLLNLLVEGAAAQELVVLHHLELVGGVLPVLR